jgi:hypothetical protein
MSRRFTAVTPLRSLLLLIVLLEVLVVVVLVVLVRGELDAWMGSVRRCDEASSTVPTATPTPRAARRDVNAWWGGMCHRGGVG